MSTILSTTKLGSHVIHGTEFPMVAELRRFKAPTGRAVYTVAQVCNGAAHTANDFRRRCDAETYLACLVEAYAATAT